jgi:mannose-6-phosphate isomerase-like protein (cupin superfamily)
MPVIRTSEGAMKSGNRPEWCDVTTAGVFRVLVGGRSFDCHYHECNEYWLIFKGKAKIMTEGESFYVKPGDIVCTRAGDEHDVTEIYEDLEAFYFEEATPEGGRTGHLHRDEEKAKGHPVPALPLPADFPE